MLNTKYYLTAVLLIVAFFVTSCSKEELTPEDQISEEASALGIDLPNIPPLPPLIVIPPAAGYNLTSVEELQRGEFRISQDGRFKLILQQDGNLVLYQVSYAVWNYATHYKGVVRGAIQTDGNLVLYDYFNRAKWASSTSGRPDTWLNVQNDGNLVLYRNNIAQWASNTCCR